MDRQIVLDPERNLAVSVEDTTGDFAELPLLTYRWNLKWAEAKERASLLELAVEEAEGAEYVRIKGQAEKVTEAHLKALIQTSPKVKAANEAWLAAKRDAETIFGALEGLRRKADALTSISANIRAENR